MLVLLGACKIPRLVRSSCGRPRCSQGRKGTPVTAKPADEAPLGAFIIYPHNLTSTHFPPLAPSSRLFPPEWLSPWCRRSIGIPPCCA